MIPYIAIFLILLTISFVIRRVMILLNRGWFKQGVNGDAAIHFKILEQLKKNFFSKKIDEYVIPNKMWYPLCFHHYAYLFPIKLVKKHLWLPSLILFSIFTSLYLIYVHYLEAHVFHRGDYYITVICATVFLFSISNLVFNGPAITYISFSERLLGRISCAAYLFCLSVYLLWGDIPSVGLAVLFGSIVLCSSIFGRQLIIFSTPFLSLLFFNAMPLLILAGSSVISILLYRRYFVNSIIMNFKSWGMYFTHYNMDSKITENVLNRFFSPAIILSSLRTRDIDNVVYQMTKREPFRTLWNIPELFLFIGMVIFYHRHEDLKILLTILPIIFAYFLTAQKKFNQFGEAYRYIEFGLYYSIPFYIAYILKSNQGNTAQYLLIPYFELVIGLFLFFYFYKWKNASYPTRDKLKEFLDRLSIQSDHVVFTIDKNLSGAISARAVCKTFWWQPGGIATKDLYAEYIEKYPYLKRDFISLFKKHKVTHIIADKNYLNNPECQYDLSQFKVIAEDSAYVAYAVDSANLKELKLGI